MDTMASQITSLTIVYLTVYTGADQENIKAPRHWLLCGEREREIKFIGLFEDRGHRGPYSPYEPFNHNLYIGIIIFPHIDNPQYTGYN